MIRFVASLLAVVIALSVSAGKRGLVASLNKVPEGCYPSSYYSGTNDLKLVSWKLLPSDSPDMTFNLYVEDGDMKKLNSTPLVRKKNLVDMYTGTSERHYLLCDAQDDTILDEFVLSSERISKGLPYFSIPVKSTADIDPIYSYNLNDGSIGDLDGDGVPEIIVRREIADVQAWVQRKTEHSQIWEAYRLDGTFMWRVLSGPNISTGNSPSFAVYDFDGDGRCEVAIRTCEGFTFADGSYIDDANDDGIIDYRRPLRMGKFGATNTVAEGLKNWPIVYGDFLGDWREEIIMPSDDQMSMLVFISWYPTEYAFPTLRSDHVYDMSMVNQNVGYNMPTQLGWYMTADSWNVGHVQPVISDDLLSGRYLKQRIYNIQGIPVDEIVVSGYYIIEGKLHYIHADS